MKTTTNYHLNQWDPGDRILRTDFNGDNEKIDAAIQAAENRISSVSAQLLDQLNSAVSTANGRIDTVASTTNGRIDNVVSTTNGRIDSVVSNADNQLNTAVSNMNNQLNGAVSNANNQLNGAVSTLDSKITAVDAKIGIKLIRTVSTNETASVMSIPLGSIDWASYRKIYMEFQPSCPSTTTVGIYLNQDSLSSIGSMPCSASEPRSVWTVFFPMYCATRKLDAWTPGLSGAKLLSPGLRYSELNHIRFICEAIPQFSPGTTIRIYGEL